MFLLGRYDVAVATMLGNVSIPYSSGQCFFLKEIYIYDKNTYSCFNPLFIRSVFLLDNLYEKNTYFSLLFQSLIHQVSVSFKREEVQSVTLSDKFQSLIHQVSVSFGKARLLLVEM